MPAVPMGPDGKPIQMPWLMQNETVNKAYAADPRTQLANGMMQAGANTAPAAGGGWAWADGLARVLSGVAGGYVGKKQREKYGEVDKTVGQATQAAMQQVAAAQTPQVPPAQAVQTASAQPPAGQGQQAVQQAPAGGGGGDALHAVASTLAGGPSGQNGPSGAPPTGFQVPPVPMGAPGAGSTPQPASRSSGYVQRRRSGLADYKPAARQLYASLIIPQEGGTNPDGSFRVSPKGAVGPGQVMPATAPEAAKLAGLPWDERKYRSDAAYNNALGEAYFAARLRRWNGDPLKAAVAYNGGDGAVIKALRGARKAGDNPGNWAAYIPTEEGRDYHAATVQRLSGGEPSAAGNNAVPLPPAEQVAVPDAAVAIARPDRPADRPATVSPRMQLAQALLADPTLGGGLALTAMSGIPEYYSKGQDQTFDANENALAAQNSRDNIAYQSDMQNWQGQQGEAFNQQNRERQAAIDFNYGSRRDTNQANIQNARDLRTHGWDVENREDGQAHDRDLLTQRGAQAEDQIDLKARYAKNALSAKFVYSAGGQKALQKLSADAESSRSMVASADRIDQIAQRMHTGGVENSGFAADMKAKYKRDFAELQALTNQIVLDKAGGSLGVAFSDADRKFIQSMVKTGPDAPKDTILRTTRTIRSAAMRREMYNDGKMRALSGGYDAQFNRAWSQYTKEVPFSLGGEPVEPIDFDQWYRDTKAASRLGIR